MIKHFTRSIAIKTTFVVLVCVYLISWAVIPLLFPITRDVIFYGLLQLSLFPLILIGQKLVSATVDERSDHQYSTVIEALRDIRGLLANEQRPETEEETELVDLTDITERLKRIEALILVRRGPGRPRKNPS